MATIITHSLAAGLIGKAVYWKQSRATLFLGVMCASLPDLDVIGYWLHVPYESFWGHRGISHSLFLLS